MNTFEKEIAYVVSEYDPTSEATIEVERTKTVTFKELNRLDKAQHKLHFKLISVFENIEREDNQITLSADGIYDITVKAINILCLPNENFTEMDKQGLLSDSVALLNFGMWLIKEKITPFFLKFKMT